MCGLDRAIKSDVVMIHEAHEKGQVVLWPRERFANTSFDAIINCGNQVESAQGDKTSCYVMLSNMAME